MALMKLKPTIYLICLIGLLINQAGFAAINTELTINGDISKNAKNNATEQLNANLNHIADPATLVNWLPHAQAVVQKALQPFGYFNSKIDYHYHEQSKDNWQIAFNIKPGKRVRFNRITIKIVGEGASDQKLTKLQNKPTIKSGQFLNTTNYQNLKIKLFQTANNRGYLDAKIKSSNLNINLINNTANVNIVFDTGPRYYFGNITLNSSTISTQLLQRFLTIKPGMPFSEGQLTTLEQAYNNTNYFNDVDIQSLRSKHSKAIPIQIHFKPAEPRHYLLGAGYGTDTGLRGLIGLRFNRVNQYGHKFQATYQPSQKQNNLKAYYTIPGSNPNINRYFISAAIENQNVNSGNSHTNKAGAGYITNIASWQVTSALTAVKERYQILSQAEKSATILAPSTSWLLAKSNNPNKPTRGYRANISLTVASGKAHFTESNQNQQATNFAQVEAELKLINTIFHHDRWIARGSIGYSAIKKLDNLPFSYQFFTGGAQSVRGYEYKSIGPGRNLITASFEYQHLIANNWYLATFIDAGNASNDYTNKLHQGVGIGLAWQTPIGSTLEITLTSAITEKKRPIMFQISMSPEL